MDYVKFLRWGTLAGLFLTLFVPFIISTDMFFPFITGKNFAFRVLVELTLGLYILLALKEPKYRPRYSWILAAAAAFVVWMALATVFSVDPVKSFWSNFERMEGYIGLLHLFVYMVVAGCVLYADKLWQKFFELSVVASAILGSYGIFQLMGLIVINQGGVRLDGTLGNATYLAAYMLFNIFIALFLLARAPEPLLEGRSLRKTCYAFLGFLVGLIALVLLVKSVTGNVSQTMMFITFGVVGLTGISLSWWVRDRAYMTAFIILALLLEVSALLFTESRGPLLGTLGGLFVAALYIWYAARGAEVWPRLRKVALWGMGVFVVLALVFFAVRGMPWVEKVPGLARLSTISLEDKTVRSRLLYVWPAAFQGFLERPVTGWGQENFSFVFNKYYDPRMYDQEQWFDRTHNSFLDWLIAGGLPAFALFIALFVLTGLAIWRSRELSVPEHALLLGLLAAYAFHSIFVFDNLVSSMYFFLLLGFAHAISQRELPMSVALSRPVEDKGMAIMAPLVAVLAIGGAYALNAPGYANATGLLNAVRTTTPAGVPKDAAVNFAQFRQVLSGAPLGRQEATEQLLQFTNALLSQAGVNPATAQTAVQQSTSAIEALLKERPDDARLELFYGAFLNQLGQFAPAEVHLQKAIAASPGKQTILFELGVNNYLRTKDYANAVKTLEKAYLLEPRYDNARIYYAIALYQNGQKDKADVLIMERWGTLTPTDSDTLLQAYFTLGMYDRVIAQLMGRLAQAPNDTNMRLTLASVRLQAGDKKGAIAEVETAAKNDPNFAPQAPAVIKQIQDAR